MKITGLEVVDWRFPTSIQSDGSDAVHKDPDVRARMSYRVWCSLASSAAGPALSAAVLTAPVLLPGGVVLVRVRYPHHGHGARRLWPHFHPGARCAAACCLLHAVGTVVDDKCTPLCCCPCTSATPTQPAAQPTYTRSRGGYRAVMNEPWAAGWPALPHSRVRARRQ
jgi:hypothetical protein